LKGKLPSENWEILSMARLISSDTPAKKMEDFAALITRPEDSPKICSCWRRMVTEAMSQRQSNRISSANPR
jgi:hypothetical protein